MNTEPTPFFPLINLFVIGIAFAWPAYLLAIQKGRDAKKWVILCFIPIVNLVCVSYFIGATNLRLEAKIDKLLEQNSAS